MDYTGLTDDELEALKQSNIDNFVNEQKKINANTKKSIEAQIKWNQETSELENTLIKILEALNKKYERLLKHTIVLYVCVSLLVVLELMKQFWV